MLDIININFVYDQFYFKDQPVTTKMAHWHS